MADNPQKNTLVTTYSLHLKRLGAVFAPNLL